MTRGRWISATLVIEGIVLTETTDRMWSQPAWIAKANEWILSKISSLGFTAAGPIEQIHTFPWSTVFRVPTDRGDLYFKAVTKALVHEALLTQLLARWRPDCIPRIYAVDDNRGWLLMENAGIKLRDFITNSDDLSQFDFILPLFAQLQRELAEKQNQLLDIGVPDWRLAVLPGLYEQLLEDTSILGLELPWGISSNEYGHLKALVPHVQQLCKRLQEFNFPESLDHGDFNLNNIFIHKGKHKFLDWGDVSVTHPFAGLRPLFSSLRFHLGQEADSSHFKIMRNLYLEAWMDYASSSDLEIDFNLGQRISWILAVLRWKAALSSATYEQREPYLARIPAQMREFLLVNKDLGSGALD
jgi:hypothetical protein